MQAEGRNIRDQVLSCLAALAITALTGCSGAALNEISSGGVKFINMPQVEEDRR
jgi:hypothetical protein